MQEEVNQKISQLVDGELKHNEALDLLKKIRSDELLKCKMRRYQTISQVLKTDEACQVKADFSDKIFRQIQQEPIYLLPQKQSLSRWAGRTKLYAVAASTIAVAVLVGQNFRNFSPRISPTLSATTFSQQSPSPNTLAQIRKQQKRQPLNAQFNDYLQAHNNSVYTNGEATFQPYAKVTSYGRD